MLLRIAVSDYFIDHKMGLSQMISSMIQQSEADVHSLESMSIMQLRLKHQQNLSLVRSQAAHFEDLTVKAKVQQEEELKLQE